MKPYSIHGSRRWLPRSVMFAVLVSLAACSSNDDDDAEDNSDTTDTTDANETSMPAPGVTPPATTGGSEGIGDFTTYTVELSPGQEVPPVVADGASGTATLNVNLDTGAATGTVNTSGLSGAASMAHIHAGFGGRNGPVLGDGAATLVTSDGGSTFSLPENFVFDAVGLNQLSLGGLYFNVHTAANTGGEVRGQIVPEDAQYRIATLDSASEVPPVTNDASGNGVATITDIQSNAIDASIFTTGVDDAVAAHIHLGAEDVTGPPIITLVQDADQPGIWRTPDGAVLTAEEQVAFTQGNLYFNVHTPAFPDGAIRGQFTAAP